MKVCLFGDTGTDHNKQVTSQSFLSALCRVEKFKNYLKKPQKTPHKTYTTIPGVDLYPIDRFTKQVVASNL